MSSSSTHAQPKPTAIRRPATGSRARARSSAASIVARSAAVTATCAAWPGTADVRGDGVGEARDPAEDRVRGDVGGAGLGGPVGGEGPDAVEQPVAGGPAPVRLDGDQGPVDQALHHVERRRGRHVERGQHVLDAGHRRPGRELRERPEAALVVGEEQVVAPRTARRRGCAAAPDGRRWGRRAG